MQQRWASLIHSLPKTFWFMWGIFSLYCFFSVVFVCVWQYFSSVKESWKSECEYEWIHFQLCESIHCLQQSKSVCLTKTKRSLISCVEAENQLVMLHSRVFGVSPPVRSNQAQMSGQVTVTVTTLAGRNKSASLTGSLRTGMGKGNRWLST